MGGNRSGKKNKLSHPVLICAYYFLDLVCQKRKVNIISKNKNKN